MRSLPLLWATDPVQTSGTKIGEPTKIYPDALAPQGEQPGPSGQQMGAEHMNALLAVLTEHVAQTRYAGLFQWTKLEDPFGQAMTHDPLTGETLSSRPGSYDLGAVYPHGVETLEASGAVFSVGTGRAANVCCHRKLSDGRGGWVFFGGYDDGYKAFFSTGLGTTGDSTVESSSGGTQRFFGAAYDAVNECVVAVAGLDSDTAADRVFLRLPDGDAPTLALSSVQPELPKDTGPAPPTVPQLACGGGRTLVFYRTASGYACFTSTNGGISWKEAAVPPSAPSATIHRFRGVWYVEDFLGRGPRFLALVSNNVDGSVLHSTPDGELWEQPDVPEEFSQVANNYEAAILLGDILLVAVSGRAAFAAIDLRTGQTFMRRISEDDSLTLLLSDGVRLYARTLTSPTFQYFVSGPLTAPVDTRLRKLGMPG